MTEPRWNNPDRPVILASQSPRRRSLLRQMGVDFTAVNPSVDDEQSYIRSSDIPGSLQQLAAAKALSIAERTPEALVLGADTVVVCGGTVLGKPIDRNDAAGMIRSLSGKTHQVYTGVALICAAARFTVSETAVTDVRFRALGDGEIREYIDKADWADKAGAYGIQDEAMIFVDTVFGCFYNVMGLPVRATIRLFERYAGSKGTV